MPDPEPDYPPQDQVQYSQQHADLHCEDPGGAIQKAFEEVIDNGPWLMNDVPAIHSPHASQIYPEPCQRKTDQQQGVGWLLVVHPSPRAVDPVKRYQTIEQTYFRIGEKHDGVVPGEVALVVHGEVGKIGDHVRRIGEKCQPGNTQNAQNHRNIPETLRKIVREESDNEGYPAQKEVPVEGKIDGGVEKDADKVKKHRKQAQKQKQQ